VNCVLLRPTVRKWHHTP